MLYLFIFLLYFALLAIKYIDGPLVVILQRCANNQFTVSVAAEVGNGGQGRAKARILPLFGTFQHTLEDEFTL